MVIYKDGEIMAVGCLAGLRVLDLSRLLPGPFGTGILAELGAEVIRIESPNDFDLVRLMPGMFQNINRGKKSISLNLKHPKGKEIFFQLVSKSGVVVEQFRPGVMERLGVGFEECKKYNPRIVYVSLSGYGSSGAYKDRAGHDLNYISLAGISSITGTKNGEPVIPGVQVADLTGGLYLVIGVLAGLNYVRETNQPIRLEVSMLECALSMVGVHLAEFYQSRLEPEAGKMQLTGALANYNFYRTKDGRWMSLACLEGKFWSNFCRAIGKPECELKLMGDAQEQEALKKKLREIFASKTLKEWEELSRANPDLCLEPVLKFSEVEHHPQVKERGLVQKIKDKSGREYQIISYPIKFFGLKESPPEPMREKGADTEKVLMEIGYSSQEIENFRKEGVI